MSVLFVLKIIGLILLVLLCILLGVMLLLLLVPVVFRGDFTSYEEINAKGTVSWLGPVVRFRAGYDKNGFSYRLKILFFTVLSSDKKEDVSEEFLSEEPAPGMEADAPKEASPREPEPDATAEEAAPTEIKPDAAAEEAAPTELKQDDTAPDEPERKEPPKAEKSGAVGKIKNILTSGNLTDAIGVLLGKVKKLLSHFKFKILKGDVSFSAGDPANTGFATGAISLVPAAYGRKLSIKPDFESEEAYFRGYINAGGHFFMIYAAIFALSLLFNKDIKRLKKSI